MKNEATYFPSKTRSPRGFHANAGLELKISRQISKNAQFENKETARFNSLLKLQGTSQGLTSKL